MIRYIQNERNIFASFVFVLFFFFFFESKCIQIPKIFMLMLHTAHKTIKQKQKINGMNHGDEKRKEMNDAPSLENVWKGLALQKAIY